MPVILPTTPSKRMQILNRIATILSGLGYTVERNRTQPIDPNFLPCCVLRDGATATDNGVMPADAWARRWTMDPEILVAVDSSDPAERPTVLDATASQITQAVYADQQAQPLVVPGCLRGLLAVKTPIGVDVEPIYATDKDAYAAVRLTLSLTYDQ